MILVGGAATLIVVAIGALVAGWSSPQETLLWISIAAALGAFALLGIGWRRAQRAADVGDEGTAGVVSEPSPNAALEAPVTEDPAAGTVALRPAPAPASPGRDAAAAAGATRTARPSSVGKAGAGKTSARTPAKKPADKTPAGKTRAAKASAAKTSGAKTSAAKTGAAKKAAGKTSTGKTSAGKTRAATASAAKTSGAKTGAAKAARRTPAEKGAAAATGGSAARPRGRVVALLERNRFHRPDCRFAAGPGGRTMTAAAARTRGLDPCGICKP